MRLHGLSWVVLAVLLVCGCVRHHNPGLAEYPGAPELLESCTAFYEFIKHKELDLFMEQEGLKDFFPDNESYYAFLDTILPPMRDRRFMRHRILSYTIHSIHLDPDGRRGHVRVTFYSDDVLPFGKKLEALHEWNKGLKGWYPGEVSAPPATWWDKLR